jgi:hypothetical protein
VAAYQLTQYTARYTLNSAHHTNASKQHTHTLTVSTDHSCQPASHKTIHIPHHTSIQGSSPLGSGLISVSISSTSSSRGERGLDMFAAFFLPPDLVSLVLALAFATWIFTGPFFRSQPTASGGLGPRSGAGATLTRLFRCFAKEKRRFFQLRVVFWRWAGGEAGAKVDFALEAESLLAVKPILTDFM